MAPDDGLERFLGWRQVRDLTGLGRTTAWRMRQAGDFPQPVPISPGRVAWRERDIAAWNESRGGAIPMRVVERTVAPIAKPRTMEGRPFKAPADKPPPAPASKTSGRPKRRVARRSRSGAAVAEGQLGFDF